MPAITLPDGPVRQFDPPALGQLTRIDAVAYTAPIAHYASLVFIPRRDPEALEMIRHDAAHVLAEAVQELYPGTQVTIGPSIENGFYYDFARNEPFTPDDFPAIEAKMRE